MAPHALKREDVDSAVVSKLRPRCLLEGPWEIWKDSKDAIAPFGRCSKPATRRPAMHK